ncbi:MAG TPA: hypothetical protein VFZ18_07500 [Longimicrobiaceae bacterium]
MRPRFRLVAALLALLALSTSVVEQAWAAACIGADGSSAMVAPTSPAPDAHAAHAPGGHESNGPQDHRGPGSPEPGDCPMAAASGMVCGAAALPVVAASAPLGIEVQVSLLPAADEAPGSLALSSLFRPPRR